jgi:hypothetical protein
VTVVVRRSALRMWLMAMGGIPLLVISLDVLTNRRLTNNLREILFRPERTQIFEPRDVIWAWAMLFFAVMLVVWGLKELFAPTKVLECRVEGLALKVNGPFRPPSVVPWDHLVDVGMIEVDDEGRKVPFFSVAVRDRRELPEDPWGGRWIAERQLGVLAEDWAENPRVVAEMVGDYAVKEAERQPRRAVASLWDDEGVEEE